MGMHETASWWTPDDSGDDLVAMTVADVLDETVRQAPGRDAVAADTDTDAPVRWTYAELHRRVERLARGLLALGVQRHDRVAIWAPNVPDWLVAEFAIASIGAVLVTVNPSYRGAEAAFVLDDAGVSCCLLVPTAHRTDLDAELAGVRDRLPRLRHVVALRGRLERNAGSLTLDELGALGESVADGALADRRRLVDPYDAAQIQYTSGTTGRPKGALLTHHSLVNNARLAMRRWGVGEGDRWCNPMPFFHTTGCGMMAIGIVIARACHCPVERFDADRVLDIIAAEHCTLVETVPTMLVALLERRRRRPRALESLTTVGTSGAPVPRELHDQVRAAWGARLLVLYGLTEASPTITSTSPDDPVAVAADTVGRPLPHTEVRIVDTVSGLPVGHGLTGELQTRGYLVMRGYLGLPDATSSTIDSDGWLSTGDLATMAGDGSVSIVGRLKDVIIRGGENLYPVEIENEIRRHPDILEACVVGVPDPFFGEEAHAAVQLRPGTTLSTQELEDFLRERVTHQKIPRYVTAVDSYPQTASGKIQRFLLREQLTREHEDIP